MRLGVIDNSAHCTRMETELKTCFFNMPPVFGLISLQDKPWNECWYIRRAYCLLGCESGVELIFQPNNMFKLVQSY